MADRHTKVRSKQIRDAEVKPQDLLGGTASPGNDKYYGTDEIGDAGFYDLPASTAYLGSFVDGDLSSGVLTITHNLGNQYVSVIIIDNNDNLIALPDEVTMTSTTVATVDLSSYGTLTGTWRYTVLKSGASVTASAKIQDADLDTYITCEKTSDLDEINMFTLSTERLTIKSDGKVGIGTTTPRTEADSDGSVLDVKNTIWIGNPGVKHGVINSSDGLRINIDANSDDTNSWFEVAMHTGNATDGTSLFHIDDSGVITFPKGQLKFPATQNASIDANTLDDYEEGTFTPVLSFDGNSTGITYNAQVGAYTKIGNKVTVMMVISLTSKGVQAGGCRIQNLPFTNGSGTTIVPSILSANVTFANQISGYIANGANYIVVREMEEGGTVNYITNGNISNSSSFNVTVTYTV